jgi:4-amino-4-deoxy-L-arabinose transferase-like glycosyltransferase
MIQAAIAGVLQTLLVWRIGTQLFNRTVGLIAAMLNAIYIYFFYYAGALITETFYITGILWTIDSALRLVNVPATQSEAQTIKWRQWLEFGLAIGVTVLLRQVF